ncbi:MAG: DUF885 domain-containing protein [Bacteroidetes bacterium]|nr:MAG: DUF885 domain-containing protein [Bacteroidota bacterium]
MRWKTILTISVLLLLLYGLVWVIRLAWFRPADVGLFVERLPYVLAEEDPEAFYLIPTGMIDQVSRMHLKLTEASPAHFEKMGSLAREQLRMLQAYSPENMDQQQRQTAQLLRHWLEDEAALADFPLHQLLMRAFDPTADPLYFLCLNMPVRSQEDAGAYLGRINQLSSKLRQQIRGLKACEAAGLLPARSLVEAEIAHLRRLLALPPLSHPLYTSFADKVVGVDHLAMNEQAKINYLQSIEERLTQRVYPAYREWLAYCESLLPKAREDAGLAELAEGKAFYQALLQRRTGLRQPAARLHQLGLQEVQQARAYLSHLRDSLASAAVLYPYGGNMPQLDSLQAARYVRLYRHTFQAAMEEVWPKTAGLFSQLPPRMPRVWLPPDALALDQIACAPVGLEAKQPPVIYLPNTLPAADTAAGALWPQVFGQAIPGRAFRLSLQLSSQELPLIQRLIRYEGFDRGWALYAQYLAQAYSLHHQPAVWLGTAQNRLLHAALLVCDTGIHQQGWSPAQARAYLQQQAGLPAQAAATWVFHLLAEPGRYAAALPAYRRFLSLYRQARKELGTRFYIVDFHRWLMGRGELPAELLQAGFDDYLAQSQ